MGNRAGPRIISCEGLKLILLCLFIYLYLCLCYALNFKFFYLSIIQFYGTVREEVVNGEKCKVWIPKETVEAVAYDNPIPGYGTRNTINLRLWAAKPSDGIDMVSLIRNFSFFYISK